MNRLLIIVLLIAPYSLFSQDKEERKIGSFDRLKVSEGIKVYLHPSSTEKVVIEVENVDIEEVETEVSGAQLTIELSGNRYRNIDVRVDVYYRALDMISASSAASVKSEDVLKGDDFFIDVSSAGSVEAKFDVNTLEVDASSSGDAKVSGRAHELVVDVSSAGGIDAYDLSTEIARIDASSAGSAKVYVTKSLRADASSGGSIRYRGSPERSNVSSSSGGSVKRAD